MAKLWCCKGREGETLGTKGKQHEIARYVRSAETFNEIWVINIISHLLVKSKDTHDGVDMLFDRFELVVITVLRY